MDKKDGIFVLLVQPNKYPKLIEIDNTLEAMQEKVGGYIEQLMPFEDDIAIICNEEGKLIGLPLNRAIYKHNKMIEIIAGDFLIAYAPPESEKYHSLPMDMAKKYVEKFRYPETFYRVNNEIMAKKFVPKDNKKCKENER